MLQTALREDALTNTPDGFELRIGLPWIRSMPLSSVSGLAVEVDGVGLGREDFEVNLGMREVPADALPEESGWWFVQDRLVVAGRRGLGPGVHAVSVDFQLLVPYLQGRPGSPLILPFHLEAWLELDRSAVQGVSRDVA
ncbi:C-glycoside deglycosidase beta subunit domain-containing protein [Arthrobacter pascens]|uniref:C-glycoside deglycosidase beta subunit domain-containing protein n=1 Tax=Arthrobacter pascens TaxID=1677 RepID=UPI0027D76DB9|nr:DUF6379 domain-containing protein [Arthrobacter pascens]